MHTYISKHITSITSFRLAVAYVCGDLLYAGVRQIAADMRQAAYGGRNTVKCPKHFNSNIARPQDVLKGGEHGLLQHFNTTPQPAQVPLAQNTYCTSMPKGFLPNATMRFRYRRKYADLLVGRKQSTLASRAYS